MFELRTPRELSAAFPKDNKTAKKEASSQSSWHAREGQRRMGPTKELAVNGGGGTVWVPSASPVCRQETANVPIPTILSGPERKFETMLAAQNNLYRA